jgi:hypothetical protein
MICSSYWKSLMNAHPDSFPSLLPGAQGAELRYYSLARHALAEALRLCGVAQGTKVLLPSFICRDVLAAVHACGATAVWYDVSGTLTPASDSANWPEATAVLAVNYFGFAQNLGPFLEYARRTKATVIEDNAHGYGSRDETGLWLGLRTGVGIFSMRKTLRIPDGAALIVRDAALAKNLSPALAFCGAGLYPAQLFKSRLRALPVIGEVFYRVMIKAVREWRYWRRGGGLPPDPASEHHIPAAPEPWSGLPQALSSYHFEKEAGRRRDAYAACEREASLVGATPVFARLPNYCAPYGFAFRGDEHAVEKMKLFSNRQGWDMVVWPDLPGVIQPQAPEYYRNVHLINFLW